MRNIHLAALMTAAIAVAGCASKETQPETSQAADALIYVPERIAHEFYSSWGHQGRGGAALRKPTYQHVMGSEDMVMTVNGNYKELRTPSTMPSSTADVIVTPLNGTQDAVIASALSRAPSVQEADSKSLQASQDEYNRAYRKFCQGATMEMSEREWEIVALGGPKGIPASMRGKCMHSK